uniref:VWFA domain-containing protein n=1 Tax=Pygocentrus nattereri TaxID=42514 RepID=A0AAR2L4W9_PYGNA
MAKAFAVMLLLFNALGLNTGIKLDGNGYTDILVAINPAVPQNENIINQIKAMITSGSEYLLMAMDNKVFIKDVKILVPPNWSGSYEKARRETYDKVKNPHPAYRDEPYVKQMKGCGEESEYIHFTPNFLLNDNLLNAYGPRGKVFVHEWAHLRWGVFDEYNEKEPFYFSQNQQIQPTRCSTQVSGHWFEIINGHATLCRYDDTWLPTKECQFFPDKDQKTSASVMYMPSLDSVTAFCHEGDHNIEAPNTQNQKCDNKATRTVIFQHSVDKDALQTLKPLQSAPPAPKFTVIQRRSRVVCLILDVSGSMQGQRILRLQQAATIFLREIVEEGAYVGIVKFSTSADIISSLTKIEGYARESLISKLPDTASGSTNMCTGLKLGFEVRCIFTWFCLKLWAGTFTALILFFPVQLVSTGSSTTGWFNGTVPIDRTVGNSTTFTIIYERSAPTVSIHAPSGSAYDQTRMTHNAATKTLTLNIPGTAEPGDWRYSFFNTESTAQAMTLTITSRAARDDVPPVMVKAQMNQLASDGSKPMVVFAEVSQNHVPVLGAKVMATLQSDTGYSEDLFLLDNGAGADNFKNDGIYSRYFAKLISGRYSLKVRVIPQEGAIRGSHNRNSGALYVPGYIVDGKVQLNPQKPPVSVQSADVGRFIRTATGESFVVNVPKGVTTKFPPAKITDLRAKIQVDTIFLSWTAPGEDFDFGTVESYDIRWSKHLKTILYNFRNATPVNTSALHPQEATLDEQFSFLPEVAIKNGTTLFFAIQSQDKQALKSEVSNIAQVTKFVPSPKPPEISEPPLKLIISIVTIACAVAILACIIATITVWALKRKKAVKESGGA